MGRIAGERDYLSRWITFLEYPKAITSRRDLKDIRVRFVSNTLPKPAEEHFGCDVCIIFRYKSFIKLLFIEGKYPRFNSDQRWDSLQPKEDNKSHFSDQIDRQKRASGVNASVLEMFINDDPLEVTKGKCDPKGSSFVTYDIARTHKRSMRPENRLWTDEDALKLIDKQYRATGNVSIRHFITKLLRCTVGRRIRVSKDQQNISFKLELESWDQGKSMDKSKSKRKTKITSFDIPLYDPKTKNELTFEQKVSITMKEFGFRHFGFIEYIGKS